MGLYFYLFYYIMYCYVYQLWGFVCVPTIPYLGLSQINQLPNGSINFSNKRVQRRVNDVHSFIWSLVTGTGHQPGSSRGHFFIANHGHRPDGEHFF